MPRHNCDMDQANEAPPFDGAPRSIAILKAAAKDLQPHLSLKAQAELIEAWSRERSSKDARFRNITLDRRKWHRFVTRDATYRSNEPDLPQTAWDWFFERQRHAIEPFWLTMPDYHPDIPNAVAPALNRFLTPGQKSIDVNTLSLLRGEYAVCRPSFVDLHEIMVMSMTCGFDDDPSRFTINMAFTEDDGEPAEEHVDGFVIPYQSCILFQGRLRETGAPFIFIMSSLPLDPKSGGYSRGDGTLLVGASGTLSSAYPITMRRTNKPIVCKTYTPEQFKSEFRAHREIMKSLDRGIVEWR
jgi:hypothetical protein